MKELAEEIASCKACRLCEHRRQVVPGEGALDPPILFVGEGPGEEEDKSGRPFVGRAGQLLDKMIQAIGLSREHVFIANVVKCRPPQNRTPEAGEIRACLPFLKRQIELIAPRMICTLGAPATRTLLPDATSISRVRGQTREYDGIPLIPTYHPAFLLRKPEFKRDAWEDLKKMQALLQRGQPE